MASPEETYYKAVVFATNAHKDQKDIYGHPYILHPVRVAEQFRLAGLTVLAVAALLHDVVEDCGVSLETIKAEFGTKVAHLVDMVSRREKETYVEFIERCATEELALMLKEADIHDNLYCRGPVPSGMEKRYHKALAVLFKAKQGFVKRDQERKAKAYNQCPCC